MGVFDDILSPKVVDGSSAFTIRELTGPERVLQLVERALPYRGLSLPTRQRVKFTWNVGNPVATSTPLGEKVEPTTVNGMWKDKYLSGRDIVPATLDGRQISTAAELVEIAESIAGAGQLVELTWYNQARHGHLVYFDPNWLNSHDVEWEMQFEWISKGQAIRPSVIAAETSILDIANEIQTLTNDLANFSLDVDFALDVDLRASLEVDINVAVNLSASIRANASASARLSINAQQSVQKTIEDLTGIINSCNSIRTTAQSRVNVRSDLDLEDQSFAVRLNSRVYQTRVERRAQTLKLAASRRRSKLAASSDTSIIGIATAKQGQDLRELARQYYGKGAQDEWRRIMTFNGLSSTTLANGQVVLIPQVTGPDGTGCG